MATTNDRTPHDTEGPELGIPGFAFPDLFEPERLADLHRVFEAWVGREDPAHARGWDTYARSGGAGLSAPAVSELLIARARLLSAFVARLFRIEEPRAALLERAEADLPIARFKRDVVKRRVLGRPKGEAPPKEDFETLDKWIRALWAVLEPGGNPDDERSAARGTLRLLDLRTDLTGAKSEAAVKAEGEAARRRAEEATAALAQQVAARVQGAGDAGGGVAFLDRLLDGIGAWVELRRGSPANAADPWISYRQPRALDFTNLVAVERPNPELPELVAGPAGHRRHRDGFHLTDARWTPREVLGEAHYCLLCHDREKDSCSKGLVAKDGGPAKNPLGVPLPGCPLDEKISEMHALRREGDSLGALALVMLDNPMCPGTGHRICNDCMKACIFQKQEPVNIPQIETGVLTDVLRLPYGFEIYGLLARWNPLDVRRPYVLPYNGKNVLVVGLGPAGYTLAHHLVKEGFGVVGIDGLKIEPLPQEWTGGAGRAPRAIRDFAEIERDLASRPLLGFGGVSEYGITVRWDKNFLTAIYVTLARHRTFRIHGGVRFGGTLTLDDAWRLGFDHVAIAAGAGKPTIVDFENNLIRGVRKASDFLMGLQLTGAFRRDSLANLQVRLPALVVGGGLTAIDTATEIRAYYVVQSEKVLERFEALTAVHGEEEVWRRFDREEKEILREALEHGRAFRSERLLADAEGRAPRFDALLDTFGGVSIVYRRTLQESPAYRLNHEEVEKCLEEGVRFVEKLSPRRALADEFGAVKAMEFAREGVDAASPQALVTLPARTVCIAAGTNPNTTYEREWRGTFSVEPKRGYFEVHRAVVDAEGRATLVPARPGEAGAFFTSYARNGKLVSTYGDNHPKYAGSVVKAMASARDGAPYVRALFERELAALEPAAQGARDAAWSAFVARLDASLTARVVEVRRLTPTIVEVVVHAPLAAERFRPGQFYRLQNYEARAARASVGPSSAMLTMEGIALTGAWHDPARGLLSLIVLEMGVSSKLCAHLTPGEPVVVMGPTGAPTVIPKGEIVVLAGGGLGNAVLFSIAKALKANGCQVIYFAGYKNPSDLFKRDEIEAATDQVVWATDVAPAIEPRRPLDRSFVGNIVEAIAAFAKGELGATVAPLTEASRWIVIGSDRMMAAVAQARRGVLAPFVKPDHAGIGSINSPMQCMMKEICAQCLQRHVDPATGKESFVFSCFDQDQDLDRVDWKHLSARLRQNTVQEKLTNLWFETAVSGGTAPACPSHGGAVPQAAR